MALVNVNVNVKVGGVISTILGIGRLDTRRVFAKVRSPMHRDQRDHKQKEMGPHGKWKALAPTTKAQYAKMGRRANRKILYRLPGARRAIISDKSIIMRSRVRWSNAHQDGPTRVGRGSVLPQRQFLWVSDKLEDDVRKIFRQALINRWMGLPP